MPTSCFSQPDPQTLQQKLATLRGMKRTPSSIKKKNARQHLAPVTPATPSALLLLAGHPSQLEPERSSQHFRTLTGGVGERSDHLAFLPTRSSLTASHGTINCKVNAIDPVLRCLDVGLARERRSNLQRGNQNQNQSTESPSARSISVVPEPQQREDDHDAHDKGDPDDERMSSRQNAGHVRVLQSLKHYRHVPARDSRSSSSCDDKGDQLATRSMHTADPVDHSCVYGTTLARYRRLVGMVAQKSLAQVKALAAERVVLHRKRSRCASRIQDAARTFLRRLCEQRAVASAVVIQCAWRCAVARTDVAILRHNALIYRVAEQKAKALRERRAAVSIQRHCRAYWMQRSSSMSMVVKREHALRSFVTRWQRARCNRQACQQRVMHVDCTHETIEASSAFDERAPIATQTQQLHCEASLSQKRDEEPTCALSPVPDAVSSAPSPIEAVRVSVLPLVAHVHNNVGLSNSCESKSAPGDASESKSLNARLQQRDGERLLSSSVQRLEKKALADASTEIQDIRQDRAASDQTDAASCTYDALVSSAAPNNSSDTWPDPVDTISAGSDQGSVGEGDAADERRIGGKESPRAGTNLATTNLRFLEPSSPERIASILWSHRDSVAPAQRVLSRFVIAWRTRAREYRDRRVKELRAKRDAAAVCIQCQIRRWMARRCVRRTRKQAIRELRAELAVWWSRTSVDVKRVIQEDTTKADEESEEDDDDDEEDVEDDENAKGANFGQSSWSGKFGWHESMQFLPMRDGEVPPGVHVDHLRLTDSRLWKWSWDAEVWTSS